MAFFNDLKSKVSTAASGAADKAKELAEIAKLKGEIDTQEGEMNAAFLEIGKRMYETEKDNSESAVADLCGKITAASAAIAELKEKIEALRAE